MRKLLMFFLMGGLFYICCLSPPLLAQNAVANPFFSTTDWQHWTGDDPSLACSPGNTNLGMDWYCLNKNPGSPYDNGAITQEIHLFGGSTYEFSANIAAIYVDPA